MDKDIRTILLGEKSAEEVAEQLVRDSKPKLNYEWVLHSLNQAVEWTRRTQTDENGVLHID